MNDLLTGLRDMLSNIPSVVRVAVSGSEDDIHTIDLRPDSACRNVYSIAKLYTVCALGILWDRGLICLNDYVCDIIGNSKPCLSDPRWHDVTIEMAIQHQLGLPAGFLDIDVTSPLLFGQDYLRYIFSRPLEYAPGSEFRYSDGAYYLLSRVVEQRGQMPLDDFLWKELLFPMGYSEVAWSHCPLGHPMGATGLYIRIEDMVKLGTLLLNGGRWNGNQLLSACWVERIFANHYSLSEDPSGKLFFKAGMHGQLLCLLPRKHLSIAVQSFGADTAAIASWLLAHSE